MQTYMALCQKVIGLPCSLLKQMFITSEYTVSGHTHTWLLPHLFMIKISLNQDLHDNVKYTKRSSKTTNHGKIQINSGTDEKVIQILKGQ